MQFDKTIGSLSKGVFERHTSTGSEAFSYVLLSVFTLTETIWQNIGAIPLLMNEKGSLPVDVRRFLMTQFHAQ